MDPKFTAKIKENIRSINLILFAVIAIGIVLSLLYLLTNPFLSYFFGTWILSILLQALAPAFGLVYLFVLSKGKTTKQHALYLGIAHAAGLVLGIISGIYGLGWITLIAYVAGVAANGLVYLEK